MCVLESGRRCSLWISYSLRPLVTRISHLPIARIGAGDLVAISLIARSDLYRRLTFLQHRLTSGKRFQNRLTDF